MTSPYLVGQSYSCCTHGPYSQPGPWGCDTEIGVTDDDESEEAVMRQDEWARLHPGAVEWFEGGACPIPLCRYPTKRHHHLKGTVRHYQAIAESPMPFMWFYAEAVRAAERSANRREYRRSKVADIPDSHWEAARG